jgi:hypothetical protein
MYTLKLTTNLKLEKGTMDPQKNSPLQPGADEAKKLTGAPPLNGSAADKPATDPTAFTSDTSTDDKPAAAQDASVDSSADAGGAADGSAASSPVVSSDKPADTNMPAASNPSAAPVVNGVSSSAPAGRKKGLMMGLVAGLAILVLGGGAAAAYYGYVVPNKPTNVMKSALVNTFSKDQVTSVNFDGSVGITDKQSKQTVNGTFTGAADQNGAFQVNASLDAVVTTVTAELRSTDGKTFYVKLGGLAGLPQLLSAGGDQTVAQMYAPMISAVNDQWLEINPSIIKQLTGSDTSPLSGMTLNDADRKKLGELYKQHQFLTVQKALADESIKGVASHHYVVIVDKAELKSFAAQVKAANLQSWKVSQADVDSFNKDVDKVDFSKYPVDVWVGKGDKLVRQVVYKYASGNTSVDLRFTIDSYNKTVKVDKPAGSKSLLEVLGGMFAPGAADQQMLEQMSGSGISL